MHIRRLPVTIAFAIATALALVGGIALAQDEAPLVIVTDIVQGHENAPEGATCTPNNRYTHEEQIVWRTKVIDPQTGEPMSDAELEYVRVVLPDGQAFDMSFGPHPRNEPVDEYWTVDWIVPLGYPTGVLDYTIETQANDGRTGMFVMFPIESSMLTIVSE